MNTNRRTWFLFALCSVVLALAMSWITYSGLDLERREIEARHKADAQENIRLALWRMDSALSPLLARQAVQDPIHALHEELQADFVLAQFLFAEVGGLQIEPKQQKQKEIEIVLGEEAECFAINWQANEGWEKDALNIEQSLTASSAQHYSSLDQQVQQQAIQEFSQRKGQYVASQTNSPWNSMQLSLDADALKAGIFRPKWKENDLYLFRNVVFNGKRYIHGLKYDWPQLKKWLLEKISDLFIGADLIPIAQESVDSQVHMLASIPAILLPESISEFDSQLVTPMRITLILAWLACCFSGLTTAFMLRKSIDLGERRGRFVAAVTHELRTPLTTFQMYSQMLADDMVKDEAARKDYLETLKQESVRLTRIVENVLLYARVERNQNSVSKAMLSMEQLLEQILPELQKRGVDSGMRLIIDNHVTPEMKLFIDAQAIAQIFGNLIDNSCKYAIDAKNKNLHLEIRSIGDAIEFLYFDYGPGIAKEDESRIFMPFQRGQKESAGNIAGIGLGLALARELARQQGGKLSFIRREGVGAIFVLRF